MNSFETAVLQDQGSREEQQDAASVRVIAGRRVGSSEVIGVLADGVGGLSHGAKAAQIAVATFTELFARAAPQDGTVKALQQAMHGANRAVVTFARDNKSERSVAATLVAASVAGNRLHWISVGDSRAYLIRDDHACRLTVDHTFIEDQWWASRDAPEKVFANPSGDPEAVSSFIGYPSPPRADASVAAVTLQPGDVVLLASDGMYKAISESAIPGYFRDDVRIGCSRIIDAVLAMHVPEQDNVTVLAIRLPAHGAGLAAVQQVSLAVETHHRASAH